MNKFKLTFEYSGKAESWEQIRNDAENNKIKNVFIGTKEFVNVVRCKDCKYNKGTKVWLDGDVTIDCDNGMGYPPPDWFCADGERRDDA